MTQLSRYDGVQFVILTYRELLTAASPSLLKREIQLLANENGQYVKCFQREEGVEAIFSQDKGYLLAESVWDYFDEPDNLIYCEELPKGNSVMLVVIRDGNVFLDTEILLENLQNELERLALGGTAYQIKLFGHLPIGDERGQFQFPRQNVASITWLESSVYMQLTPSKEYALGSVTEAFASLGYTKALMKKMGMAIAVLAIIGLIAWWALKPSEAPPPPVVVQGPPPPPPDPYAAFKQALSTPAPDAVIENLINTVTDAYTIPGWTPQSLALNDNNMATITLQQEGGNAGILLAWKRNHPDVQLSINTGQAVLTYPMQVAARSSPEVIYKLPDLLANFYDELNAKFPGSTISVGPVQSEDNYKESTFNISFNDQSPDSLLVLVDILKGLPLTLDTATLTINEGLISGQLTVELIGA